MVTPIGAFKSSKGEWRLPENGSPQTIGIRNAILDIQYGRVADTHGWLQRVV